MFGCSCSNLIVFGVLVKWLFTCFCRDGVGEGVRAGISKIVGLGSNLTCLGLGLKGWGFGLEGIEFQKLGGTKWNPQELRPKNNSPTARGAPLTCVVPPQLGVRHTKCK